MPKVAYFIPPESPMATISREFIPAGWDVTMMDASKASEQEQIDLVKDADALIVFGAKPKETVLRAAKNVRLYQLGSAGYDGVDVGLTGELGIPVATASGTNAEGVAEQFIALTLALYRHLPWVDASLRQGDWVPERARGMETFEILGKTVGIIGAGYIGSTVMKLLQGFDCTVLYHDILAKPELEEKYGARPVSMDELLSESDIVTVHVPLLNSTRHFISRRELALMKPSAILINTSRGPTVDQAALVEALKAKTIWGAGLDVFEQEPASGDNPLFALDNIVVSGHVAGPTRESFPRRAEFAFANIRRVLEGEEAINIVTAT
ncbi:MAG: NAD(P)-dependent oxidoreductase [Chloroflexi bacterium]|nr:NAD(P)-dependent oxidoreductase [Chloroflexota bacterium]